MAGCSRVSWVALALLACGRSQPARSAEAVLPAAPTADSSALAAPEALAAAPRNSSAEAAAMRGAAPVLTAMRDAPPDVDKAPMLDIEARLTLQVGDVGRAIAEIRRLTSTSRGDVVEESISDASSAAHGQLTLRVPSAVAYELLVKLEQVGSVTARDLTAKDIGKTYYDAQLRLQNLEWQMARFEQILTRANSIDEVMRVDQEIARVRGQIEQIKGELRYMADRAARATIHISLLGPQAIIAPAIPILHPEAKFFPGLRASVLGDFLGEEGSTGYWGVGVSLRLSRHFSADVEGLRAMPSQSNGLDLFLASLGGELYSDFLGAGRRKWFNPYLGFRAGYSHRSGRDEIAAGGSLGVEIFKSELASIELDMRSYALFGSSAGAHLAVQPALGANIAF